jgi:hypothetical protein
MLPCGPPKRGAYGDGLKRRDRQSSCFDPSSTPALPHVRPSDPPGLRRLRFPFFYPLVKEQGIAVSGPIALGAGLRRPRREENET